MRCRVVAILVLSMILSSCKFIIGHRVERLCSNSVVIPESMIKFCGTKVAAHSLSDSLLKIVVYVDSTVCSSCRLTHSKPYWEYALPYLAKDQVVLAMILCPLASDMAEMVHYLDKRPLPFDVYIDTDGSFRRLNPAVPSDNRFHTLLLGSDNKPLVIGDPTRGKKVKELYDRTIGLDEEF